MSIPANITYTLAGTIFVEEPKLDQIIAAVTAKAITLGRSDLIPPTYTFNLNGETWIDGGLKLANLQDVLLALGATGPADVTRTLASGETEVQRWSLETILLVARAFGC